MNICVINGSPKGNASITLQTVLYLERLFPEHSFQTLSVGQRIKALEKDSAAAFSCLAQADLLLFAYPVYTFLAPSQLHRFLEMLKGSGLALAGKFATQITTSKHFYDMTAHRFIEDNCRDLKLKVIHGLSADMDDLLTPRGRKEAEAFFRFVTHCMENDLYESTPPLSSEPLPPYEPCAQASQKRDGFDTVIVADLQPGDQRLQAMIDDFQAVYPYPARLVNLGAYPFMGGCLGCFSCAGDGKCIYQDGFDRFLRKEIQTADAIVYAASIKNHSLGSRMKTYDDRQFCNGHRTVTEGTPTAYVLSGDYDQETNLQTVIEARAEVGHNYLAGVGFTPSSVRQAALRLAYAVENRYLPPRNFYGVGGMKIFRDLIWLMRGLMKADHGFYKARGLYDFPQKRWPFMLKMKAVGALTRSPRLKAKMGGQMTQAMLAPYQKVLQTAAPQEAVSQAEDAPSMERSA